MTPPPLAHLASAPTGRNATIGKTSGTGYTGPHQVRPIGFDSLAGEDRRQVAKERAINTPKIVETVLNVLDRVLQIAVVILMALVLVAVSWQVFSRYVAQSSSTWTAELAQYSFVWLAMLAIALGVRRGRHMLLDIWEYLPYRRWLIRLIDTIAALVVVAVLALLVLYGFESLGPAWRRTVPTLGIPYAWVILAVPVGAGMSLLFGIEAWWKTFHARRPDGPGEPELGSPMLFAEPEDELAEKGI